MRTASFRAVFGAALLTIAAGMAGGAAAQSCSVDFAGPTAPTVSSAYNAAFADNPVGTEGRDTIELGDTVTIKGDNLAQMFTEACANRPVVLYLNGWPMKGLTRAPQSDPEEGAVHFTLKRTSDAAEAWTRILGSPLSQEDKVDISMGFADGFALKSTKPDATRLAFTIVPMKWFLLWLLIFAAMLAVFIRYACFTNIIRDPGPAVTQSRGLFSLSRLQGAWWFFVIVAAYLFIGTITGDFGDTINSTALILIGIGAGTVIGSAAIDANADPVIDKAQTDAAITELDTQIAAANTAIATAKAALAASPAPTGTAKRNLELTVAQQQKLEKRLNIQLGMLKGESQGILTDILSDANGISFHRFQMAAFTLILSIVFIFAVYETLTMPVFNTTLMGLLGLSAGTYLGLKIPEAKTPTQ